MPKVIFELENGVTAAAEAAAGEDLLTLAKRCGIDVDAPCNGSGTCGKCRVRLTQGTAESARTRHISDEEYDDGWRLACSTKITSDIRVAVPASASSFRTGIRTADLSDPAVKAVFGEVIEELKAQGVMDVPAVYTRLYELSEPSLDDTMPDNERLIRAAESDLGRPVKMSLNALIHLAPCLRDSGFRVKTVLSDREGATDILDVLRADDTTPVCGAAIDIGTTTVSAALADITTGELLAQVSAGNGQIIYGADVINRIIESVKPGGSERLKKAVVEDTLVPLIGELCRQAGIQEQYIYRVSIAGNTTMEHLLLGLYSDPVRMEPFIPSFFVCDPVSACSVIPGLNSAAQLVLAPNVGSYVGGDITAGVLAGRLWTSPETTLFIDLGTNGELVLGNEEYMMCCACSAGPAFEGGDISCGMRAADGAVESIRIDKESIEPSLGIIGPEGTLPAGLCGSGIIDTVAELFRTGIISPKGKMVREGRRVAHDEHGMGRYIIAFADESANGREVSINEVDIDNFIRAKGAIFSAILLILGQLGMEPADVDHILIAGGIGSGIDFKNAITIGMFPDVPMDRFSYIGNSSLSGAFAALLSSSAEEKTRALAANMMYVELSNEPGYMDEFVAACFLPHTNSSLFPSLEV